MTTKPKARKFRVKRGVQAEANAPAEQRAPAEAARPAPRAVADADAGAPQQQQQQQAAPKAPAPDSPELDIDSIRREGLTGRQLRMARRVAQKHGLAATSDFDAVRILRAKGIDPFQRTNMLELVVPQHGGTDLDENGHPRVQLPQTVPAGGTNLPSTEQMSPAQRREREITEIQREIAARRRKKVALLLTRLAFFVMLPTLLAGYYFYGVATPMYATKSEFLILQSEGSGGAGPLGGLLPTQFATNQDAIAVQSFLQSKDALLRLDQDVGFKAHFSEDAIDPIQRLDENPSNEQAYKVFKKNVKIGYDPTEGVIRMEVIAANPEISQSFSEALISYAEERVNNLSQQKREDQMRDARAAFEDAETQRRSAQQDLVSLQIAGATLDPEAVIAALRAQITALDQQVTDKEIELASLLANARPNRAKVDAAQSTLDILKAQLADLNARMTDASQGENSLAQLSVRIQMAQADLATRDMMLQSALQQMEQSRVEANRQVRYLVVAVRPVAPDEATYPRAFENTILAFLVFAGIYLMISLTASILREQVTS
jgi:capsular polysaccharide transport system permease protein